MTSLPASVLSAGSPARFRLFIGGAFNWGEPTNEIHYYEGTYKGDQKCATTVYEYPSFFFNQIAFGVCFSARLKHVAFTVMC